MFKVFKSLWSHSWPSKCFAFLVCIHSSREVLSGRFEDPRRYVDDSQTLHIKQVVVCCILSPVGGQNIHPLFTFQSYRNKQADLDRDIAVPKK